MEVRGLEKGWGPEWSPGSSLLQSGPAPHPSPHFPSLPFTPRGRGRGRPRPDALKRGGGRRVWLANAGKGRAWGQRPSSRQRAGPAEQVGQPTPAALARLPILSALVSVTQAPPHSSSAILLLPSPAPPRGPRCVQPHPWPSLPHQGPPAATAAGLLHDSQGPRRTAPTGRGALGQPAGAAQPRPFTHGRGPGPAPTARRRACVTHLGRRLALRAEGSCRQAPGPGFRAATPNPARGGRR